LDVWMRILPDKSPQRQATLSFDPRTARCVYERFLRKHSG
jgi:hypothetical protein